MDLATLIGLIGSMGLVLASMVVGGGLAPFADVPSALIVILGSIFVVLMKFNMSEVIGAAKVAGKAFSFKSVPTEDLIEEIVEMADAARKGGLLALEGKEVSHPFLQKGIGMLVDGHDPDVVRNLLGKDMRMGAERHDWGSKVFAAFGDVGPAMGMIGTLVGLVLMLGSMDDPKTIGPSMAVALLTTLYGAMLANMIAIPISDKLKLRAMEEARTQSLIIDALMAIQGGQNPRVIKTLLTTYMHESKRPVEE